MGYEEKKERRRRYLEDGKDEVSLNAFISPVPRKGCPVSWGSLLAGQIGRPKYRGSLRSGMAWASRDRLEYTLYQC
jgi:hypothetical protein